MFEVNTPQVQVTVDDHMSLINILRNLLLFTMVHSLLLPGLAQWHTHWTLPSITPKSHDFHPYGIPRFWGKKLYVWVGGWEIPHELTANQKLLVGPASVLALLALPFQSTIPHELLIHEAV